MFAVLWCLDLKWRADLFSEHFENTVCVSARVCVRECDKEKEKERGGGVYCYYC